MKDARTWKVPIVGIPAPSPLLLLIVLNTVVGILLLHDGKFGHPTPVLWVALTVGIVVLEASVARFSTGKERWTMSVTEVVLAVALLYAPGTWVAIPAGIGMIISQAIRRKRNPVKIAFNTAMYLCTFALAGQVAAVLGGGGFGAVAGALTFWFTNFALVAAAVLLTTSGRWRTLLSSSLPLSLFHMLVNVSVGVSAGIMLRENPATIAGLLAPLVAILLAYETITRRVDERSLLEAMLSAQDSISPRPTEEYAQVILRTASDIFATSEVELVVLRNTDEPLRVTLDEDGQVRARLATSRDLDEPWVLAGLASRDEVAVAQGLRRSWATVRIGPSEEPVAVLGAHKPAGSDRAISRRDRRLAAVLASRAAAWLAASGPDQAEDADEACPEVLAAQSALRSAAYRLVDNASRLDEYGTKALVTELHRVERAVTALLGAAAGDTAPAPAGPTQMPVEPTLPRIPAEVVALAGAATEDWVTLPAASDDKVEVSW